jgi:hypothetical protein
VKKIRVFGDENHQFPPALAESFNILELKIINSLLL